MKNASSLLNMHNITMSFSGVKVLKGVNLELKEKQVLGVVGENGAGKSTLMNILSGVIKCDGGEMIYKGSPYNPSDALDACEKGINIIHQEFNLFTNMTVAENMMIEAMPKIKLINLINKKVMRKKAEETLSLLNADINVNEKICDIEMGMRQQVEIAKALMTNASIIIFDEPTTSLSNNEKNNLFKVINKLRDSGISMIYISHNLEEVFLLCDKIMVLRDGETIKYLDKKETEKDEIVKLMVGREMSKYYSYIEKNPGETVLEIQNLKIKDSEEIYNFEIKEGEIVGLYGLMGAGRTELLRGIFGLDKIQSGKIFLNGKQINKPGPNKMKENGMAFITENRGEEGLFLSKSVKDNLMITHLKAICRKWNIIDRKKEETDTNFIIEKVKITTANKNEQTVRKLSGGNQQKVVLGKWLVTKPKVFLMDEPTRGIDVGAKFEIYNLINSLAQEGSGVFIVSSEMEELIGICDRIFVMRKKKIIGEVTRKDFSQEALIKFAVLGESKI